MEFDKAENQDSTNIMLDSLFKLYEAGKIVNEDGQLYIKQNGKSPTNITSAYCILPLKEVEYDDSDILSHSEEGIGSLISRIRKTNKRELTIKDIMELCGVGQVRATKIRNEALKYCEDNMIYRYGKGVPTPAVIAITGVSKESLFREIDEEKKLLELEGELKNGK